MATETIVLVTDSDDDKRGEITVTESAEQAERLIETLLEAGYETARVQVFSGAAADFVTTYRPVVSLLAPDETASPRAGRKDGAPEYAELRGKRPSSLFKSAKDDKFPISAAEAVA